MGGELAVILDMVIIGIESLLEVICSSDSFPVSHGPVASSIPHRGPENARSIKCSNRMIKFSKSLMF